MTTNPISAQEFDVIGMNKGSPYKFMKYVNSVLKGDLSMEHLD